MNDELQSRIARLPKWARQHIDKLEKDVAWYKAQLVQVDAAEGPVRWDLYIDGVSGGIPARARVLFDVDGGTLECALRDGNLYIRGANTERPVVRPECASIRVNAEK